MLFLRSNYKHMYDDEFCPLCSTKSSVERFRDNQEHLLSCKMLCNTTDIRNIGVCYSDIFGQDQELQAKVTILLENKYKQRKQIEDKNNKAKKDNNNKQETAEAPKFCKITARLLQDC